MQVSISQTNLLSRIQWNECKRGEILEKTKGSKSGQSNDFFKTNIQKIKLCNFRSNPIWDLALLGGRDRCKPVAKNCFRARGSDIFADDVRQALVTSDEELPVDSLDGLVPPENSCYLQERDVGGCRGLSRGSF